jgi:LacI family transcriptional regulator
MKELPKILIELGISQGLGRSITRGAVKYAKIHGPWMFYRLPPFYLPNQPHKIIEWAREFQPDGIIMIGTTRKAKEFATLGIPMIFTGRKEDQYSSFANLISYDNIPTGRMAAKHLLERGFNSFAFCGYDLTWSHSRCDGFVQTIAEAGYKVQIYKPPRSAKEKKWKFEQFVLAVWLESLPKPVGIMTCIDNRSL